MSKKIPPTQSDRFIKMLEKHAVTFVRQTGSSHAIYERVIENRRYRVPIVTNRELTSKYMKVVLRQL